MPDAAECKTEGGGGSRTAKGESRGLSIKAGYRDRARDGHRSGAAGAHGATASDRSDNGNKCVPNDRTSRRPLWDGGRGPSSGCPRGTRTTSCTDGYNTHGQRGDGAVPRLPEATSGVRTRSLQPSRVDQGGRWRGRGRGGDTSTRKSGGVQLPGPGRFNGGGQKPTGGGCRRQSEQSGPQSRSAAPGQRPGPESDGGGG